MVNQIPSRPSRRAAQAAQTRRDVLSAARRHFAEAGYAATSLRAIAADAGVVPVDARFVGFALEEPYVVGYGLDHDERYRNLSVLAAADPGALATDPDGLVPRLYHRG